MDLRHERLHLRQIISNLQAPFSTVARTLSRLGQGGLRNLEPKHPVQRYEWELPGDLIHIDVITQERFNKVGHRILGNRHQGHSTGEDYGKDRIDADDATRLGYVEVLALDQKPTVLGCLSRAVTWFNGQRVECRRVIRVKAQSYVSMCSQKPATL